MKWNINNNGNSNSRKTSALTYFQVILSSSDQKPFNTSEYYQVV